MLLFISQLQTVYPTLAEFAQEKGWRCGNSFISYRAKCYRNPKTGKIAYKTITKKKRRAGKLDRRSPTKINLQSEKGKININDDFKEFKKPQSLESINNKLQGYGYQRAGDIEKVSDGDLIREWQYTSLANAALRYPSKFPKYKSKVAKQRISQLGNDTYRTKLAKVLADRGLIDKADKSFAISFISDSIEKDRKSIKKATQNKIGSYQDFVDTRKRILDGNITAEEIKQAQLDLRTNEKAILEDLGKFKKDNLLKMSGWGMRRSDKKDRLVKSAYQSMEESLLPPGYGSLSYSYEFGADGAEKTKKNRRAAIDKKMVGWSDDLIKDLAQERKSAIAEREKSFKEPKTINDFRTIVRFKGKEGLTPQQRRTYEELVTVKNREERKKNDLVEASDRSGSKQSKTVNSLRANAEKLIERNEEKLNQDRLVNTARRARMAAGVEDDARGEIAIGKTMLRLAEEKEAGNIQFLDRVKAGTEVRQLNQLLNSSRHKAARAIADKTYPEDNQHDNSTSGGNLRVARHQYSQRNRKRDEVLNKPIDDDIIEYAEYPYPNIHKDHLRSMLDEAESQNGMKLLASRLRKKYKAIAPKDEYVVDFKTAKEIEDFRRLTTQGRFSRDQYGAERAKESLKDYDRINKTLDLKTPYELRAALREYNRLRSKKASEDPIKLKERELIGRKIEGYFPTPKPVIDKMLEYADLKTGQKVLEPSAGKGNIADRIIEEVGNDTVSTIEIDPKLSELLDFKGYNNRRDDFLNITDESYDRIVMNPPFEKLQDIDHVKQAYELLEPGGRVVSVMSESPFFQQQKKAKDFRKWLAEKEGFSEQLPPNSFKSSERSTGVNTRIVVIEKPITEKKKRKVNYSFGSSNPIVNFSKKCGKGYISENETCYTNQAGKTTYTYKINPKTGRRNKVKRKVKSKKPPTLPNVSEKAPVF